jgi:CRISPR-associated protein Csm3
MSDATVTLLGQITITGKIHALTGLRIGGRSMGIEIGDVGNIVLRNPINGHPYVPGSSLKGKMRSLFERVTGAAQNHMIDRVRIHSCHNRGQGEYDACNVCQIFGVPAEGHVLVSNPTPLIVRDVPLWLVDDPYDAYFTTSERLRGTNFTEVKWEAAIDRITSAAVPRQMERVPAGAIFSPFEVTYNVYSPTGLTRFDKVVLALQLVEDDFLGGQGSRGSGKVAFEGLNVTWSHLEDGARMVTAKPLNGERPGSLADVAAWVATNVSIGG